jgi:glutamate synthase domain-containing protein 3
MFQSRLNPEMVVARPVKRAPDIKEVKSLIEEHYEKTNSLRAKELLENWDVTLTKLIRVIAKGKIRSRKSRRGARSGCRCRLDFLNSKRSSHGETQKSCLSTVVHNLAISIYRA